ncbi:CDGSH iron-sulfur domain-containing protein [Zobellia barbeyronii]|uniref:CDGSH iron-sulfur domain-containing protein n=1 Tax=Zobellia barbeyronii TaxID=2748009 RepID=A0ABS5WIE6_9FLAO|nr:CDGSH iron-sulfur domain-containing protein [Zobellia barbeyronii]MBT2163047.1 CDGSH iron-sulfur domain-containing protein [Zobellia barbeyronii]
MSDKKFTPVKIALEKDKRYAWCTCGHSETNVFCDGSHKQYGKPGSLVFQVDEDKEARICTCKLTSNPPYCDGSHNN